MDIIFTKIDGPWLNIGNIMNFYILNKRYNSLKIYIGDSLVNVYIKII